MKQTKTTGPKTPKRINAVAALKDKLKHRAEPPTPEEWKAQLQFWGEKARVLRQEAEDRAIVDWNKLEHQVIGQSQSGQRVKRFLDNKKRLSVKRLEKALKVQSRPAIQPGSPEAYANAMDIVERLYTDVENRIKSGQPITLQHRSLRRILK